MKQESEDKKPATPFFRKPGGKFTDNPAEDADGIPEHRQADGSLKKAEAAPVESAPEVPKAQVPEPVKAVVDATKPKVLSPILPDEPTLTFRAKDDFSDFPVKAYLQVLRSAKYAEDSPEIMSIQAWLARREAWRAANSDKCKRPDY